MERDEVSISICRVRYERPVGLSLESALNWSGSVLRHRLPTHPNLVVSIFPDDFRVIAKCIFDVSLLSAGNLRVILASALLPTPHICYNLPKAHATPFTPMTPKQLQAGQVQITESSEQRNSLGHHAYILPRTRSISQLAIHCSTCSVAPKGHMAGPSLTVKGANNTLCKVVFPLPVDLEWNPKEKKLQQKNLRQSDKSTDEIPRNHDSPLVTIRKHNTRNGIASGVTSEG
ncbi:hypothetical protein MJG53_016746 [Ovis ammon polii x Ovis aries]|uniref:Uncharacterized protein n=1 Tax=Ovis ammon polii x Ovis aries TaxID=2918886 RepID=A0ACB9U9J9_9CETA|nr:hypothetical protein MJG53_016746 [Ovis ammon polii x Ovis aries]